MGDKHSRDLSAKETYTEARFLRNSHEKQISIIHTGGAFLFPAVTLTHPSPAPALLK